MRTEDGTSLTPVLGGVDNELPAQHLPQGQKVSGPVPVDVPPGKTVVEIVLSNGIRRRPTRSGGLLELKATTGRALRSGRQIAALVVASDVCPLGVAGDGYAAVPEQIGHRLDVHTGLEPGDGRRVAQRCARRAFSMPGFGMVR